MNKSLLIQALTHRSFVNESGGEILKNNESLEFLGDAVLGFIISSRIFQLYPDLNEGELSKIKAYLVSAANLVQLAKKIQYIEIAHQPDFQDIFTDSISFFSSSF